MTLVRSRDFGVVAIVSGIIAIPLWVARFPLGQDLPAHVETAAQIVSLWRGGGDISAHYQLHAWPWPNSAPTVALAALMLWLDGLVAAKLLLSMALWAWPLSLAAFLQRTGRSPLLALVLLPTTYDLSFAYGFFHFELGKPLWLLCIVLAVDVGRVPTRRRSITLALSLVALFSTHLLLFVSALPLCSLAVAGASFLKGSPRPRLRDGSGVVAVLVASIPFFWWRAATGHSTQRDKDVALPIADAIAQLWDNLGNLSNASADAYAWVIAGVVVVVVGVAAGLDRASGQHRASRPTPLADASGNVGTAGRMSAAGSIVVPWLVGLSVMGFALLGPIKTATASVVAERFSAPGVALLCCALLPRGALSTAARGFIVVAGVAIALAMALPTSARFRAFSAEQMGDFDTLVDEVPAGAVVATHFVWPLSKHGRFNALWHWPKLVSRRGAVTDDSFAFRDTCVVGIAPGAAPPRRRAFAPGRPISAEALGGFDHLLVQGQDRRLDRAVRQGLLVPVTQQGVWSLFRVTPAPSALPSSSVSSSSPSSSVSSSSTTSVSSSPPSPTPDATSSPTPEPGGEHGHP